MKLQAWKITGKNPSVNPPVHISIAPIWNGEPSRPQPKDVFPWVLPLYRAVEMFGQEVVDKIGGEPVPVELSLLIL